MTGLEAGISGVGELKAGRELDALVAERLQLPLEPPCPRYHVVDYAEYDEDDGWTGWCYSCDENISGVRAEPRRYSTDIAAAWEVVEKMRVSHQFILKLEQSLMNADEYEDWSARFDHMYEDTWSFSGSSLLGSHSAPLAICLAALMAVEHSPEIPAVESSSFGEPE